MHRFRINPPLCVRLRCHSGSKLQKHSVPANMTFFWVASGGGFKGNYVLIWAPCQQLAGSTYSHPGGPPRRRELDHRSPKMHARTCLRWTLNALACIRGPKRPRNCALLGMQSKCENSALAAARAQVAGLSLLKNRFEN